jgi:outer membrane protein assembly factor BamB
VLLLGGAAAPAPEPFERALTVPATIIASALSDDALFTVNATGDLRASPLRPGGPKWTRNLPVSVPNLIVSRAGLVVLSTNGVQVTVLDPATGDVRYQSTTNETLQVLGDRAVVWDVAALRLSMIDLGDGYALWSRRPDGGMVAADERHIIVLDDGGRVRVLSTADGRDLTEGRRLSGAAPSAGRAIRVIGDLLLVYGRRAADAYALTDLSRRWTHEFSNGLFALNPCGDWICTNTPGGLTVLDPATGTERWTDPRWRTVGHDGVVQADDLSAARLDLATGRVVEDLGHGWPVEDLMLSDQGTGTAVTRQSDGGFLGMLPPVVPFGCRTSAAFLSCPTADRRVLVWRRPR